MVTNTGFRAQIPQVGEETYKFNLKINMRLEHLNRQLVLNYLNTRLYHFTMIPSQYSLNKSIEYYINVGNAFNVSVWSVSGGRATWTWTTALACLEVNYGSFPPCAIDGQMPPFWWKFQTMNSMRKASMDILSLEDDQMEIAMALWSQMWTFWPNKRWPNINEGNRLNIAA